MDERAVVTCFLRNEGQVLLLRRSERVETYPGRWGTVTGYLTPERDAEPEPPETAARREIREETGLDESVTLVRQGEAFVVEDGELVWRVHPFIFDCDSATVEPDEETDEWEWVHAPEIRRRETVPDLWASYERVRPTVATIRDDHDHGSAWLSLRALEVLRDEAAEATERGRLETVASGLAAARPGMTVIENRINRAMHATADGEPAAVEAAAIEALRDALVADREAAAVAADRIDGERVCTLSRSGTVLAAIEAAEPSALLVAESRPGGEGVTVAEELAERRDVTLTSDAALASRIAEWAADVVLVGADTVLPDGRVVNKVGTRAAALSAAHEDIPCFVVAAADKVSADNTVAPDPVPAPEIYDGDAALSVDNPLFDVTPAALVTGVCTEDGVLDAGAIGEVAERHERYREW